MQDKFQLLGAMLQRTTQMSVSGLDDESVKHCSRNATEGNNAPRTGRIARGFVGTAMTSLNPGTKKPA